MASSVQAAACSAMRRRSTKLCTANCRTLDYRTSVGPGFFVIDMLLLFYTQFYTCTSGYILFYSSYDLVTVFVKQIKAQKLYDCSHVVRVFFSYFGSLMIYLFIFLLKKILNKLNL